MKIRRALQKISPVRGGFVILIVLGIGTGAFIKNGSHLSPGPLSAAGADGHTLEGYDSHADFEQECTHCHAPLHCVGADRCQDCHVEIAEQRLQAEGIHGLIPGTIRCQNCHIEHRGRDARVFSIGDFSHEQLTDFTLENHQLDYQGVSLDCDSCHGDYDYAGETLDCTNCHAEQSMDFMSEHSELYGSECTSCHDGTDHAAEFSHDDVYPLAGAHAEAECNGCHAEQRFSDTPDRCSECHEEPALHRNLFGKECERCHLEDAWVPAHLIRHTFMLNHGDEGKIPCETCHVESYTAYPCYACHDEEEMRAYHLESDIVAFENCIECHPTGRFGEATPFQNQEGEPVDANTEVEGFEGGGLNGSDGPMGGDGNQGEGGQDEQGSQGNQPSQANQRDQDKQDSQGGTGNQEGSTKSGKGP